VACLFFVPFSPRPPDRPRTLVSAMADLVSHADSAVVPLVACVPIVVAACLPPLLWVELAVAERPLSRRMRALLIGQGAVGLAGIALTALCMSLALSYFGFGGDTDPTSAGCGVILAFQAVFVVASVVRGVVRG
jgi:hypothetical protein